MTSPVSNSEEHIPAPTAAAPSASDPTTAGAAVSSNKVTSKTKLGSLEELKKISPKMYNELMQSIGMTICRDMEHHQDRLKQLMQEARREGG